jgi:hypothetical protein
MFILLLLLFFLPFPFFFFKWIFQYLTVPLFEGSHLHNNESCPPVQLIDAPMSQRAERVHQNNLETYRKDAGPPPHPRYLPPKGRTELN